MYQNCPKLTGELVYKRSSTTFNKMKRDKLIIIAEVLEDESSGNVYLKLTSGNIYLEVTSDSQSHMTMLIENGKKAPEPMEISLHGELGYRDTTTTKHFKEGYNQALRDCGVLEE